MHLRALELHGFKAFAERQRFEFGPGITVVVGPNGSGKSNVADAIRWALGEQSTRQIRARRTEDVIFSGSEKRRAMGSAEVTLTLDNAEGWMPIDFGEVAVTRRAERSGENSYRINGQRVRLGDVLDLFRRAQVGQNSYAMMTQGLVDEVLALRPRERRALIEEAGELGRHRHQLVLSERRLTETRDNLGRVRMLLREIEPRVRQLERQSRRAQRYRELAHELADALSLYFETELRSAQEALAAARAEHDQRSQAFAAVGIELAGVEERATALEADVAARRRELAEAQARERALAEEALGLEQQVALAEQRQELLGERATEIEHDVESLARAAAEDDALAADQQQRAAEASALAGRHAAAAEVVERERVALGGADEAARLLLRELAETEARRARHEAEREELRRQATRDAERAERAAVERERAGERRTELLSEARAYGLRAVAAHERAGTLESALAEARRRRDAAERALEEEQRQLAQVSAAVRAAEALVAQLEERRLLVQRFSEQAPAAGAGAQALLEAARIAERDGVPAGEEAPPSLVGAVGRLIRVPEGLEDAIEAALAEQIGAIVVESDDDALAALDFLREHRAGSATIYALERVAPAYPLNLFNERGVIGVAARLVRTEQRYRGLVDALLGRTIVVEDLATARRMLPRGLGSVVTRDGILLRPGGAVFGGRGGATREQFTLQRELEELPEQLRLAREQVSLTQARLARQEATAADARELVTQARRAVDGAEADRRAADGERESLARRFAPLAAELRQLRATLAAPVLAMNDEGRASRVAVAKSALAATGEELAALRDRSQALVAERDAAVERVTAAQAALATLEGERRAAEAQREERAAARSRDRDRLAQRREQLGAARREREDLALQLTGLRQRLVNARSTRGESQQLVGPAHAALAELEAEERELAARRTDGHARQLEAERELLEAEARLRRHAEAVQTLLAQIADEGMRAADDGRVLPLEPTTPDAPRSEFDAAPESAPESGESTPEAQPGGAPTEAASPLRGGAEVSADDLRERVSGLRAQIRTLGPVNVEALAELEEERQRVEFLTTQVGDLEAAEAELRGAITELRRLIRRRFTETFEQVNTAFSEYFRRFFGGGHAELRMEKLAPRQSDADADDEAARDLDSDDDDGAVAALMDEREPGVEITAQPPGKRIANLAMLSGGERSMTSVALLFALLSVNPAPVCVLDEVDAALDEANVGRFVETLRELTARSQFIVISHNRRTIEAADAIYGVSMGDDSVSRVLSLRLDDVATTT
jgi:chromosome segregation protein